MARPQAVSIFSWQCSSCIKCNAITSRTFATSAARHKYGPESPRYIDVPEPPQRSFPPRPRLKGVLPVPRDVFKYRTGGHKAPDLGRQPDAITPYAGRGNTEAEKARNDWKQKMTDMRKTNFREGLTDLATRKRISIATAEARTRRKEAERARIQAMPEPEDERLTNPSIALVLKTQLRGGLIPDPDREMRVAAMKARVAAHAARKAEDRQEALHTLYMHARNFITTEAQLDSEIDRAFGTSEAPVDFKGGNSIWSTALPESIKDKLNNANKATGMMKDANWIPNLLNKRIKTVAEKLTGGKIE